MGFERWDELLVAEHEQIERAMEVMKAELVKLGGGGAASLSLRRAVDFLLELGDRIHNVKEERFLFPRMAERGIPVEGGPISVMLAEHQAERELLGRLVQTLPALDPEDATARQAIVREGQEYLGIRANHIWKENDVLYAMGRQVLNEQDNDELMAAFRQVNRDTYGEQADQRIDQMLQEVEKSSSRTRLVESLSRDQLHAIFETLPMEVTFVDAHDSVAYFNRLDKEKIFVRTRSVIGRQVELCHPAKSRHKVLEIVKAFKDGSLDNADFWLDIKGDKILIRYFPVRDDDGTYLGVLEVTQSIGWIQKLEGSKTLL